MPSDTANCTLKVEIAVLAATTAKGGSGWSAFDIYKPGVYWGVAFKFKVTVTRADTTYQVKLFRFQTRVRRIQKGRYENTHVERASFRRILRS